MPQIGTGLNGYATFGNAGVVEGSRVITPDQFAQIANDMWRRGFEAGYELAQKMSQLEKPPSHNSVPCAAPHPTRLDEGFYGPPVFPITSKGG